MATSDPSGATTPAASLGPSEPPGYDENALPSYPPFPPYESEPSPAAVVDAIIAGRELRLKHKPNIVGRKPSKPAPRPAKPKSPKATDVKLNRYAARAYARCLRKHDVVLTDRLEHMSRPPRRAVIYLWRELADVLPASTIDRFRSMLDADEPFKPDQAYEYFTNLRKTKKHMSKSNKRNMDKKGVCQLKKDLMAMITDKRFVWARNATVAFGKGVQKRLSHPTHYDLADGMERLSNIVMAEICGYMHRRPPPRHCLNPKSQFLVEMCDKVAVWIDQILSESDERMLMMDFDEDEDIQYAESRYPGFTDNFLNMMGGGGYLKAPTNAYVNFAGPMSEAFKILTDSMKRNGEAELINHGKFRQTFSQAADELKKARSFDAKDFNTNVARQIKTALTDTLKSNTPKNLEGPMKDVVDISANYLAQNAEYNKDKGPAFQLLLKTMRTKPNEMLYQRDKTKKTYGQAANDLEKAKGLEADYDDPNLSQEIHASLTKTVEKVTPSNLKTDMTATVTAAAKYLSQAAVDESDRGPAFDLLISQLKEHGAQEFDPANRHLKTNYDAAHALENAPGLLSVTPDKATAPKYQALLQNAVAKVTPPNMKKEMSAVCQRSGNYLSGFGRDRDKAIDILVKIMKSTPTKETAKRNEYAMDYGTGAKELEAAPNLMPYLPIKDIADEIKNKLNADVEGSVPNELKVAMKAVTKDSAGLMSQTVAERSGAAGDRYKMNLEANVLESMGDKPLYKHKQYGLTNADAAEILKYSSSSPEEPKSKELKQALEQEMKSNLATKTTPTVQGNLQGTTDVTAKIVAKAVEEKADALERLVGLMKSKGDVPLCHIKGYEQTYSDAVLRIEIADSFKSNKVDKAAYEAIREKLKELVAENEDPQYAKVMPEVIEEISKFLASPVMGDSAGGKSIREQMMEKMKMLQSKVIDASSGAASYVTDKLRDRPHGLPGSGVTAAELANQSLQEKGRNLAGMAPEERQKLLATMTPDEKKKMLAGMSEEDRKKLVAAMSPDELNKLMAALPAEERQKLLATMTPDEKKKMLAGMSEEDRKKFVAAMSPDERNKLMATMSDEEKKKFLGPVSDRLPGSGVTAAELANQSLQEKGRNLAGMAPEERQKLLATMTPDEKKKMLAGMSEEDRKKLVAAMSPDELNKLMATMSDEEKKKFLGPVSDRLPGSGVTAAELANQSLQEKGHNLAGMAPEERQKLLATMTPDEKKKMLAGMSDEDRKKLVAAMSPDELNKLMAALPAEERQKLFATMTPDEKKKILAGMSEEDRKKLVAAMSPDEFNKLMAAMPAEERQKLLATMTPDEKKKMLAGMSEEDRKKFVAAMSPDERNKLMATMSDEEKKKFLGPVSDRLPGSGVTAAELANQSLQEKGRNLAGMAPEERQKLLATMTPDEKKKMLAGMSEEDRKKLVAAMSPDELNKLMAALPAEERHKLFATMTPDEKKKILAGMSEEDRKKLVAAMSPDEFNKLMAAMPAEERQKLLATMTPDEKKKMLAGMSEEDRKKFVAAMSPDERNKLMATMSDEEKKKFLGPAATERVLAGMTEAEIKKLMAGKSDEEKKKFLNSLSEDDKNRLMAGMSADEKNKLLASMSPEEVKKTMAGMSDEEKKKFLAGLSPEQMKKVLAGMTDEGIKKQLAGMSDEEKKKFFASLSDTDRNRLMAGMSEQEKNKLMSGTSPDEYKKILSGMSNAEKRKFIGEMSADEKNKLIASMSPEEVKQAMAGMSDAEKKNFLAGLSPEQKRKVLAGMTDEEIKKQMAGMSDEEKRKMLSEMSNEQRQKAMAGMSEEEKARLIADMSESDKKKMLGSMSEEERKRYKAGLPEEDRKKLEGAAGMDDTKTEEARQILHKQLRSKGREVFYKQSKTEVTHDQASDWLSKPKKVEKSVRNSGDTGRLAKKFEKKLDALVRSVTPGPLTDAMDDVIIESARTLSDRFVSENYQTGVRDHLISEMQKHGNEIVIEIGGAAETAFFAAQRLKRAKAFDVNEPCNEVGYRLAKNLEELVRCRSMPRKLLSSMKECNKKAAEYLSALVTKPDEKIEAYVTLLGEMESAGDTLLVKGNISKSYKDAAAYLRQLTSNEDQIGRSDSALQSAIERDLKKLIENVSGYSKSAMSDVITESSKLLVSYIVFQGERTEVFKKLIENMAQKGDAVLLRHGKQYRTYSEAANLLRGKNTDQLGVQNADPVAVRKIQIKLNNLMQNHPPDKHQGLMDDVIDDTTMYLAVHLLEPHIVQVCKCMKNVFVQCELWCEEILRRISRPCCTCSRHVSLAALEDIAPRQRLTLSPGTMRAFTPGGLQISLRDCPTYMKSKDDTKVHQSHSCPATNPMPFCGQSTASYLLHSSVYDQRPFDTSNTPTLPQPSAFPDHDLHLDCSGILPQSPSLTMKESTSNDCETAISGSTGPISDKRKPFWQSPTIMYASTSRHNILPKRREQSLHEIDESLYDAEALKRYYAHRDKNAKVYRRSSSPEIKELSENGPSPRDIYAQAYGDINIPVHCDNDNSREQSDTNTQTDSDRNSQAHRDATPYLGIDLQAHNNINAPADRDICMVSHNYASIRLHRNTARRLEPERRPNIPQAHLVINSKARHATPGRNINSRSRSKVRRDINAKIRCNVNAKARRDFNEKTRDLNAKARRDINAKAHSIMIKQTRRNFNALVHRDVHLPTRRDAIGRSYHGVEQHTTDSSFEDLEPLNFISSSDLSHNARAPIIGTDQMLDWHAMMVSLMWNVQAWRDWIQDIINQGRACHRHANISQKGVTGWSNFQKRVTNEALQWRQYNIFSRQLTLRLSMRYKDKKIVSPTRATVKTDVYVECQKEMLKIIGMFNRWTQLLILIIKEVDTIKPETKVPLHVLRWKQFKKKVTEFSHDWSKYNLLLKISWEHKYRQIMSEWIPTWKSSGPVWVVSACGAVPSGAVAAGLLNQEVTWVARTTHRHIVMPAALVPSKHCCLVYADGEEHRYTKYQVMCNANASWIAWRAGEVGQQAVRVATSVFVGRVLYRGSHLVGAVLAPHYRCHVVIFGRPFAFNCYELLVIADDL